MTADIRIEGQGMYQIAGITPAGQEFVDGPIKGAENGVAYSDQTDMTMDIAEGARDNGLVVAVNGREYLGDNIAGEEVQL